MKLKAAITGIHGYVPEDILTNEDLEKLVDTNDEWIVARTGIKERHIQRGEGLATSHMAAAAVKGLLEKTGTDPKDIELVICATVTPDYMFPSTANLVCTQCGIPTFGSFVLLAVFSGFLYAINLLLR